MKLNPLILTLILITITGCEGGFSTGLNQYKFVCEEDIKPPTTFIVTPKIKRTFIQWQSTFFEEYPPKIRCLEVTNRMNKYLSAGSPRYVTHGTINGEPVICVTDKKGSDCKELIYTLKRETNDSEKNKEVQDPNERLRRFLEFNRNEFNTNPLVESPSCRPYIEIKAMIDWIVKENEEQDEKLDKTEVFCTEQK